MTDAASASAFTTGSDDELEFDAEVAPPEPEPRPKPKRRRAAATEPAAAAPAAAAPEAPAPGKAEPTVPEPQAATAPEPALPSAPRRDPLLLAVIALSLLTSLLSLGAVIAVGRTLAAAHADRARAQQEADALARLPALVAALDRAAARTPAAPAASAGQPGTPLTADDLRRGLDGLRLALDARQPSGMSSINGTLQAMMSELATRLDRIESRTAPVQPGRRPIQRRAADDQ